MKIVKIEECLHHIRHTGNQKVSIKQIDKLIMQMVSDRSLLIERATHKLSKRMPNAAGPTEFFEI